MDKIAWHEPLYNDAYNPAIRFFKKACGWVLINMPDASGLQGIPRYAVNIFVIFGTAGLAGWAFVSSQGIIELALKVYLASFLPAIAFNKSFAAGVFGAIEKYQAIARSLFNKENEAVFAAAGETLAKP